MVLPKKADSSRPISDADTAAAAPRVTRPQRTAALIANDKIKDLPEKLSEFPTYKLNAAKSEDSSDNTISTLPAKDKKVPPSTATTKPTQKSTAEGSPKHKAYKPEKTDIDNIASKSSYQPASPRANHQRSQTPPDAPNKNNAPVPSKAPHDATAIWKSVRGQTAAEKRDLRKQQKERVEKMKAQKKPEQEAEQKTSIQKEKMKFMVPSSDEAVAGSLTDEEEAEAEAYVRGVAARIGAMASVSESVGRNGLDTCKDQDQVMGGMLVKEAPPPYETRSSPRKPQSSKAKVKNPTPDMDIGNEDKESSPHVHKPQRPKTSYKRYIVDDEDDEDDESPPHLRKPQRGRAKKAEKVTTAIQLDEDYEESPQKRTPGRLRKPSAKAAATALELEDDDDEGQESPPCSRRVSCVRQQNAAKAKARIALEKGMEDIVGKSSPRTCAPGGHPPKAATAKARAVGPEDEDEDEDMEVVVDKSPPHTRGGRRAAPAKRPKAKIGDAPRIDPYDEASLYISYAGLSLNTPNKTLDKARLGEGMGHRKHK